MNSTPPSSPSDETQNADSASLLKSVVVRSLNSLEFPRIVAELVSLADTEPAREALAQTRPDTDIVWIREELHRVEEIRSLIARGGSLGAGGCEDLRPLLKKTAVIGSVLSAESLLVVLYHLRTHAQLRHTLNKEQERLPLVKMLARDLRPLPDLEVRIDDVVSPEGFIRDRASPELARIRRELAAMQVEIRKRIGVILGRLEKAGALRGDSFTIRDGRYVLPVRSDAAGKVRGIVHDRSSTGGTLFIEPSPVIELGNELRSLELAERDEIRRILAELTDRTRRDLPQIRANLDTVTALDCLWSKARLAERLDAVAPELNQTGMLKLVQARHPLLIIGSDRKVVPLDLDLGGEHTCLVISGPNAGGKSVALKCVGLLCAMTAAALPIPALPGTEIPLFEDFFAVIGDQQSISDDLSTFTAHSAMLKEIIASAHQRSLVLVDEIGAGTDPQEGASLSISVLERLITRQVPTIVTTHHGVLKAFAHSTPGCTNGSMEFDRENFRPTYRFHPYIPGSSYALEIARRVGLPEDIIARARMVLGSERSQLDELILSLTEKLRKYESMVKGQERKAEKSVELEDACRIKLEQLLDREKELKKRSRAAVEQAVTAARKTIEAIVREIREAQASKDSIKAAHKGLQALLDTEVEVFVSAESSSVEIQDAHLSTPVKKHPPLKKGHSKPSQPRRHPDRPVIMDKKPEVGDWVLIDGSDKSGEVMAVSSRGDRLCVGVGSIQLWISLDRVRVTLPPSTKISAPVVISLPQVPLELDLRGMEVAEALEQVDQYLYNGSVAGREQLGLIHGKGKGVLSHAVRGYLKTHRLVESYRYGDFGGGDYGVTVVQLKKSL